MFTQNVTYRFLKTLDCIDYGSMTLVTPDGRMRSFGGANPGPQASLELSDWRVVMNLARRGMHGFLEDYRAGLWRSDNLQNLFSFALENEKYTNDYVFGSRFSQAASRLFYLFRLNSIKGSRKNIHAHYDIGNDFYELWLDPSMTYSAALFAHENEDLTHAQMNKYDRMIDCLGRSSGELLEIGCGWGGFAERALEKGDYAIKGITLSEEQHDYARDRLNGGARIALEDYRHQGGKYDNIISIEMFEAVGEKYWPVYFGKLKELLSEKGKAVIQTITIDDNRFHTYRRRGDVIRSYIFPGGMLPSEKRFNEEAVRAGLKTGNTLHFGEGYAKTLELWQNNFHRNAHAIQKLGFDDGFMRVWDFYLSACIAGFRTGRTSVMQTEVSHV